MEYFDNPSLATPPGGGVRIKVQHQNARNRIIGFPHPEDNNPPPWRPRVPPQIPGGHPGPVPMPPRMPPQIPGGHPGPVHALFRALMAG